MFRRRIVLDTVGEPRGSRIPRTVVLLAVIFAAGCGDGPTAPRQEQTPSSTPTPVPTPNLAGSWRGNFQGWSLQCDGKTGALLATARFDQIGSSVTGEIRSGCGVAGSFAGAIRAGGFTGRLEHLSLSGTATETHISMKVDGGIAVQGTLTLDRSSP